jgi:ABC-type phosphate transport system substrate-binding protein
MRRTCPDARAARNASVILVVAGLMSFATNVFGSEVKLIANPALNVDAISVNEVKGVFLGEKNSLKNGTHVQPVLQKRGAVHVAFLEEYLDESDEQLQLYYRTVVFTGKGAMPKTVGSDAEVVAYVARTRGAIGYVDADAHVRGVKTLSIMRAPKGSERALINRIEPHYPPTLLERAIGVWCACR